MKSVINYLKNILNRFALISVFVIALFNVSNAQFLHIEDISVPFYVNENSPVSMTFKIKNTGFNSYNGTMIVYMAELSLDFPKDIYSTQISLNPNDSIFINPNDVTFQNFFFQYGNNIVVVWPKGIGVQNDSVTFQLYMDYSLMIEENNQASILIYPNPVVNELNILNLNNHKAIEHVRIFDTIGKNILCFKNVNHSIDLSGLKQGLHFIEITFNTGEVLINKIQKL
ncbi:MAG: T9SS type A sorting domain-containing protein [Bacteroidia bacterium]